MCSLQFYFQSGLDKWSNSAGVRPSFPFIDPYCEAATPTRVTTSLYVSKTAFLTAMEQAKEFFSDQSNYDKSKVRCWSQMISL